MKTQHTPGPWRFAFVEGTEQFADIFTLDKHFTGPGHEPMQRLHLATVYTDGADDSNARLIASAPDLLASLEVMLAQAEVDATRFPKAEQPLRNMAMATARAAIRKATAAP